MREIQAQLEAIAQTLYAQLPPATEEITEHSALLMNVLLHCLNIKGRVDLGFIYELLGAEK